jgi:hypothetical protein
MLPEPVPLPALRESLPTRRSNVTVLQYGDPALRGFDVDFIHLVFVRMLNVGWRIEFIPFNTYTELYLGVMAQLCHVAISGAELDPVKALCPQPVNPAAIADYGYVQDYEYGDYLLPGGLPGRGPVANGSALNLVSCLSFGAPYVSSGFALMSFVEPTQLDVVGSLFSSDVLNCATVMIIITVVAGFVVFALERRNPHLGTLSRSAYWSFFFLLANSDEDPRNKAGRTVMALYALCNLVTISVLTSIVSAKLTTTSLSATLINSLADVGGGTLCMEDKYDVLNAFVLNNADKPPSVVATLLEDCVAMLLNGTAVAVITDAPTLRWYNSYYAVGAYISPMLQSNLFAFVYSDTAFMQYVNPAVIAATQTDPDWLPFTEAIKAKYFPPSNAAPPDAAETSINYATLAAAVALAGVVFFVAFTNGDVGPGLPCARYRALLGPSVKVDMSDEDAAMVGDAEAATRCVLKELRSLKASMAELRADVYETKQRARSAAEAVGSAVLSPPTSVTASGTLRRGIGGRGGGGDIGAAPRRIEPWSLDGAPAAGAAAAAAPRPQSVPYGGSSSRNVSAAAPGSGGAPSAPPAPETASPFCVPFTKFVL